MKKCPNCNQSFSFDNDFCLDDGTRLVADGLGLQTASEIPTQFISRPPLATPAHTQDSSKWLYLIVGLLAATVIVGGIVIIFKPFQGDNTKESKYETVRTENSASNVSAPLPVTNASSPKSNASVPASVPERPKASTVRVRFAKGAITSSPSGSLFAGEIKNYVLACRAGKQLTATISTSKECIIFSDNSTVCPSITKKGDNSISIKIPCRGNGGYRLDITII